MKMFIAAIAVALLALTGGAFANPDCSNVDPSSRLAGCFGVPEFAVAPSQNDNGRPAHDTKAEEGPNYENR